MSIKLGRISNVDLRSVWTSEDRHFTPWLAQEENLELLGKAIGIELELEAQEKNVGPFRADILCKNTLDDSWVLIENQIEKTDHTHLGQLLTYASGLHAVTIVWISSRFTQEHRAALDWLNEITDENIRFFGLEVALWQINDSIPAPQFKIISQPNDWSNNVAKAAKRVEDDAVSELRGLYFKYWTSLSEYLLENSKFRSRSPQPRNWYDFSLGKSNVILRLTNNAQQGKVVAGVYLQKSMKYLFDNLHSQKEEIERNLGFALEWENDPAKQTAVIKIERPANIMNNNNWIEEHAWHAKALEDLDRVFRPLVRL